MARVLLAWNADPSVIGGAVIACAIYWLYTRGSRAAHEEPDPRRDRLFIFMMALLLLDLESPIDWLSDNYLFSVHMVQHMVLMLGIAPLLVMTMPPALVADVRRFLPGWFSGFFVNPIVAFVLAAVVVWAWHASGPYELALHDQNVHTLEHLTFLESAFLFWWVALAPASSAKPLPVMARLVFVFLGGLPGALLGAALTFSTQVYYPTYAHALDNPGLGRTIELRFGLVPLADQQLGGLIMWVPGGFFYLMVIVAIFLRWAAVHQASGGELPGIKRLQKPPRRTPSRR